MAGKGLCPHDVFLPKNEELAVLMLMWIAMEKKINISTPLTSLMQDERRYEPIYTRCDR